MDNATEDKEHKVWQFLHEMHLYEEKGEAIFKGIIIVVSWVGAVYMDKVPDIISTAISANIFLFTLSLIMEYAMRLITVKNFTTRILPSIIVLGSSMGVVASFCELIGKTFIIKWEYIYKLTALMTLVIAIDVIVFVITNAPPNVKTETNLKKIEVD